MDGRRPLSFIVGLLCALAATSGCQTARELTVRHEREPSRTHEIAESSKRERASEESEIALTAAQQDAVAELEAPTPDGVVVPPAVEPESAMPEAIGEGG